jgi:hypothetical protein
MSAEAGRRYCGRELSESDWAHTLRLLGRSGAGLEEPGVSGSTVWGAKLGSDGSPRRGRRVKGQSRSTAGCVSFQASPVTLPSERAKDQAHDQRPCHLGRRNLLCPND